MHRLIRTLAFATLLPLAAAAQQYPNKVVRLMVPFPPGGATDIVGRLVSAKMQDVWGQPVVVENKPARERWSGPTTSPSPLPTATPSAWWSPPTSSTRACAPTCPTTR